MSARCILLAAALLPSCVFAQAPASSVKPPAVTFHLERTGLPVPVFTLRVQEDGTAEYFGEEAPPPRTAPPEPRLFRKQVNLGHATVEKIFAGARSLHQFQLTCASKAKNIADTGTKTLTYSGPEATGSCTFNYSENKYVQALTSTFLALALTMDTGRRLEFEHRYDRLGLDAETDALAKALEEGLAADVLSIAPTLEAIAADTEVIERVRLRAARLLQAARDAPRAAR